jgi:hypothetical protein
MTGRLLLCGASALLVSACGGGAGEGGSTAGDSAAARTTASSDVQLAATVARAIDAAPDKADSILVAHGLTMDGLDSLMYAIAADSTKTAAYEAARR